MGNRSLLFGLLLASFGVASPAYAIPSPSLSLALGADASASDNGWGGGATKSDLVDGKASYYDTWMHGLAAPLGWPTFHVILDFRSDITFNSVVAWWHRDVGGHAVPNVVDIEIWDAATSGWDKIFSTAHARDLLGPYEDPTAWTSRPTEFSFAAVTSNKLRLSYDNLELYQQYGEHGWLHEVSVFNEASAVPEPGSLILLGLGLTGMRYARRRTSSSCLGRPSVERKSTDSSSAIR